MKKSVLITGASGGLGGSLVEEFAAGGWRVIATDKLGPKAGSAADAFVDADLADIARDEAACSAVVEKVFAACGDAPLACLVNNAAVQRLGRLEALSHQDIVESIDVNLIAPFILAKGFAPALTKNAGSILNIGSVHGQATKPEFSAYATSKAGIHGLSRALAVELGPSIRVLTVAPAATATDMLKSGFEGREEAFAALEDVHPLRKIATPSEIARLAVLMASDAAAFMTGSVVYADGGVLSRLHDPV